MVLWNQINKVESCPSQALSNLISDMSRVSLKNPVATSIGSAEERGRGRPLTLRFSSLALRDRSSTSLACTTSSTAVIGGDLSFPRTTCAHELMCVSVSCLRETCCDIISSCLFLISWISACKVVSVGSSCTDFRRDKFSPSTKETLSLSVFTSARSLSFSVSRESTRRNNCLI